MKKNPTAILLILAVALMTFFSNCKKNGSPTPPVDPNPGRVAIKQATIVAFQNADASGYPTRCYGTNGNTTETAFAFNENSTGTYSISYRSRTGQPIVGTPRPGTTNTVSFYPNVGDTLDIKQNGVLVLKVALINDNADIVNQRILVERIGFETNEDAGIRLNNFVANILPTMKLKSSL